MAKVLIADKLSKQGLEILDRAPGIEYDDRPGLSEDQLAEAIKDYDALVIRSGAKVTAKVINAAEKLRVIGRAGIGVDNVDVKAASRRGIIVMNTPTGNAVTTAEHAIALLFSVARHIAHASASMKEGKWEKNKFNGVELSGKVLGVIGLGNIGRIVANRAQGLKMNVIGFDPVLSKERAAELGIELVEMDELIKRADAITVHTPLTPQTKGLVNDDTIAKMKKGVILINAARGGIYDEAALIRGLDSGKIAGVGVDVYLEEPPGLTDLVKHPKVVATPHLGASTVEAQERVAVEIVEQVVAYLVTGEISNSVNVPAVPREMASVLGPYLTLGLRMGEFLAQVEDIEPKSIEVESGGDLASLSTAPVVNAAVAGFLTKFLSTPANPVNAPHLAQDRGIEIRKLQTSEKGNFSSLLTLTVVGTDGRRASISGTLGPDRNPRLVRWGKLEIDAHLEGAILVIRNEDRPGVIGTVGTVLGQAGINVSRMQVGVDPVTRAAVALWALDAPLPAAVLEQIRSQKNVNKAHAIVVD